MVLFLPVAFCAGEDGDDGDARGALDWLAVFTARVARSYHVSAPPLPVQIF